MVWTVGWEAQLILLVFIEKTVTDEILIENVFVILI